MTFKFFKLFLLALLFSFQLKSSNNLDSLVLNLPLRQDTATIKLLNSKAFILINKKEYSLALKYGIKAYGISKKIQSKRFLAQSYSRIGTVYLCQKNYTRSFQFYSAALKLYEEVGNKTDIKNMRRNIGKMYLAQKDYPNLHKYSYNEEYTFEDFRLRFANAYHGFMFFFFLYNLFLFFFAKDRAYLQLSFAILFFFLFYELSELTIIFYDSGFGAYCLHYSIMVCTLFFANFFFGKFLIELIISKQALVVKEIKLLKKLNNICLVIIVLVNFFFIAFSFLYQYNYSLWDECFVFLITNYNQMGFIVFFTYFIILFKLHFSKKELKLNFLVLGVFLLALGVQTSILYYNGVIKIVNLNYHGLGGCLFLLLMSVEVANKINIYRNEKETAQQKAMQNLEEIVESRTSELKQQKNLVDEKQKEILDSISYAKRLQEAILPPQEYINENIPDNFVLYKPKDIVAGDFYWAEKIGDLFFIAAADSTGHGVPGAMVSVVCSNALNRTVKEFKLTETGKILDKTRELVLETFAKSTSEVKDGMDISLLCINSKSKKIFWSGANNPLWYIYDNILNEIKPDKQPIGKTEYAQPFTSHQLDYKENTTFYLFTDGLADQFGGPKGKKFKYKQLSDLLVKNNSQTQIEQKKIISRTFEDWKGNLEQVDDVCMIGIKI